MARREAFDAETRRATRRGLRLACATIIALAPPFAVLDAMRWPQHLWAVLVVRGALVVALTPIFVALRGARGARIAMPLLTATAICVGAMLCAIGAVTGGHSGTYARSLPYVVLLMGFLLPVSAARVVGVSALVAGLYAVWVVVDPPPDPSLLVENTSALVVTTVLVAIAAVPRQRLRRRAFEQRMAATAAHRERRQGVARLADEARLAAALVRAGRELIALVDTPLVLERVCQLATELLGCDSAHTWVPAPDDDAWVEIASWGDPASVPGRPPVRSIRGDDFASTRARLEHGGTAALRVSCADADPERAERMRRFGLAAVMYLPLRRDGQMIGVLTAERVRSGGAFSALDERIGSGLVHLASFALANARLVEQLARVGRLKSEFVSTMSHELRTPLNVIVGFAELAIDPAWDADARRDLLERMRANGMALLRLIDDTLEVGRIEAGRCDVELEPLRLPALCEALQHDCAGLVPHAGVTLTWSSEPPDVVVHTDRHRIGVIVRQLVDNALKFTDAGHVAVTLGVEPDGRWSITVADTGIGIRPEDRRLVFEMFRQADGSDSRRHGGVGLGLYIVARFVEQLGGSVHVDSTVGAGSVFVVGLPASHARRMPVAA